MNELLPVLERIAAALERLAPASEDAIDDPNLCRPIEEFDFSNRVLNVLGRYGVCTVGELFRRVSPFRRGLLVLRGLGTTCAREIEYKLNAAGIEFPWRPTPAGNSRIGRTSGGAAR